MALQKKANINQQKSVKVLFRGYLTLYVFQYT